MKTLGIQIRSNEAILVVLTKDRNGVITQTAECAKYSIHNPDDCRQVQQFRDQVNAALDIIGADQIAIMYRNPNAKGKMTPSPISFKLEGIFQLYEKTPVQLIAPQTTTAFFKKNEQTCQPVHKYQQDAFDIAYYLIIKQQDNV